MTAQIVLMNGYGIAISSDSAVSLGSVRTFETAEKIYPIELPHRLAVMHAGSVTFGGIPFPVLITEWTKQLSNKPLRDITAYKNNFADWLGHHSEWFSDVRQENQFMWFVNNRIKRIFEIWQEDVEADKEFSFSDLMNEWILECEKEGAWEGVEKQDYQRLTAQYYEEIIKSVQKYEGLEELLNPFELFLEYLAVCYGSKILAGSDFISVASLVFVGYGENQILPGYVSIEIAGVLQNKVAYNDVETYEIHPDKQHMFGLLLPAQKDAIELFLRGYDYDVVEKLISKGLDKVDAAIEEIVNLSISDENKVVEILQSLRESFEEDIFAATFDASDEVYLKDLRKSLASIPLGTLAEVAKSLVEIQGLRQTTNAQFNSVGGPTDVAVINPANGFQWVYHKSL